MGRREQHILTGRSRSVGRVQTVDAVRTYLSYSCVTLTINPLTPNDPYRGRTAPLTSKRCILYIYSTNIYTEYFKHGIYSPFFPLQNAICFIILTYLIPVLFTFYIRGVLKLKKNNNSGAKRLNSIIRNLRSVPKCTQFPDAIFAPLAACICINYNSTNLIV